MTTTIAKLENSQGIRLPKLFFEFLGIRNNDMVDVRMENDAIVIRKSTKRPQKTLKQRVEEFYGKDFETVIKENPYEFVEVSWGKPAGNEVW